MRSICSRAMSSGPEGIRRGRKYHLFFVLYREDSTLPGKNQSGPARGQACNAVIPLAGQTQGTDWDQADTDLGTLLPTLRFYDISMVVHSEPQRYAFNLSRSQDGEGFVYCTLERMLGASLEKSGSHISRPVPISILPFLPIAPLRTKRPQRLRGWPSAYRVPKN